MQKRFIKQTHKQKIKTNKNSKIKQYDTLYKCHGIIKSAYMLQIWLKKAILIVVFYLFEIIKSFFSLCDL